MRVIKFDTLKAIAMASVVIVHVYAGISFPKPGLFRQCFIAGVLGASMFLFAFISGWVIRPGRWNWNRLGRLLCIAVAANFLVNFSERASGFNPSHGYANVAHALWYMAVLLACKIILPVFRRPAVALCLSVLISWTSFLLPDSLGFNPLDRFLGFIPFFSLGYFVGNDKAATRIADWLTKDSRHMIQYRVALVLATLAFVLVKFTPLSSWIGAAIINARAFVGASWKMGVFRIAAHLWFGLWIVLWFKAVPNHETVVAKYGKRTLAVYLLHMIPIFLCAGFLKTHPRYWGWRYPIMTLSFFASMLLFHHKVSDLFSRLLNGVNPTNKAPSSQPSSR